MINSKIKQYEDELKLVPLSGEDTKLTTKITELNGRKGSVEAEKTDVDAKITTLTGEYNDLKTKYNA